eukprot:2645290-Ditylum_brightwellii.AAC.1
MAWALTGTSRAKPMHPLPNQGKPSEQSWVIWQNHLKECFALTTSKRHWLNKPIKLQTPLEDWTMMKLYTAWEFYYDSVSKLLFANRD